MAQPIMMPKFGQTVEEAEIVKWHKAEGDKVDEGEILFEIETDKATLEVESFHEGHLLKIFAREGDTVPVQSVVGYLGEPGEEAPDAPPAPPAPKAPEKAAEQPATKTEKASPAPAPARRVPPPETQAAPAPRAAAPAPPPSPSGPERLRISPRARKVARESAIDPSNIQSSGPAGRIVEQDVREYLSRQGYEDLRITPAAKKKAVEEEIDVLTVTGTGEAGRIVTADIERAISEKPQAMSRMRQVIAGRLTESFTTTPHFFVTVSVDMTDLLRRRKELKTQGNEYSVTDFIMESVVLTLKEFPACNSSTDGVSVRWNGQVHLGVAVALEDGLVVPVLRGADGLTFAELRERSLDLFGRARTGKLTPDEMSGSTFTISNMGMLGVDDFTAIINPGESAILAVASTQERPVVRDGRVVVRSIMKMTVSADHRIIDGAMAARFINTIKAKLEDPESWNLLI